MRKRADRARYGRTIAHSIILLFLPPLCHAELLQVLICQLLLLSALLSYGIWVDSVLVTQIDAHVCILSHVHIHESKFVLLHSR